MTRRDGGAHDLEGEGREGHADQQLGHPDAPASARHQPAVGAAGEHAAAGDGVAVERCHKRLRQEKYRVERPVHDRQEVAHIVRPARTQPQEIDAGGKYTALPGEHDGADFGSAKLLEAFDQGLAQFDVERTRLAVRKRDDRNAILGLEIDHDRPPRLPPACTVARLLR